MRRLVVAAIVAVLVGAVAFVATGAGQTRPASELQYVVAEPGDSWYGIRRDLGLSCTHTELWGANGGGSLLVGQIVLIPPSCLTPPPPTTTPATTAPATTQPPQTTPDTEPPAAGFLEDFNGEADALDRFVTGVFHRDDHLIAQRQWEADHNLTGGGDCTGPDQTHTVHRANPDESFYTCASVGGDPTKGHMMTSVGDTSGYSIAWFTPDGDQDGRADVFEGQTSVSWDVNVTDLRNRQWWEVVILPVDAPFLTTIDWVASTAEIEPYHPETIALGKGPFGNDQNVTISGDTHKPYAEWAHVCGSFPIDPEACASKAIRRSFTITDNRDGTVTFDYLGERFTYAGAFPDRFVVYFKDHNYTPDKDGRPVGYTWHWDNIAVR